MATYQYSAVRMNDKRKVQSTINADSERQARELLREQGLYPTVVKLMSPVKQQQQAQKKQETSALEEWFAAKFSSIGSKEKISFTQNVQMMVKAGIPITEALLYMESYMDNVRFKKLINTLRLDILAGYSFSRALGKHKDIFNEVYVSIIQAGEASGELEEVLARLSEMLIAEEKLKKKVISAMTYPTVVICIAVIVVLVMFIFVLPTFSEMYANMGIKLPPITAVMVGISDFMRNFWYIVLALSIGGFYAGKRFVESTTGKEFIDETMLKLPVVSPMVRSVASANFISTLNVSFSAGLPITDCIFMACQTVTHTSIRKAFDEVNIKIQAGQRIASAMADSEILPAMVSIMISTGEESGALDQMLKHALDYLDEEVNQRVEVLIAMMEPCLLVVLGGIVLCMALAIYLPLFGMYEHIGG